VKEFMAVELSLLIEIRAFILFSKLFLNLIQH